MAKFVLMLNEKPGAFQDIGPEEMQRVIAAYDAWAGTLAAEGRFHGGEKLDDEGGRLLSGSGASFTVTDGPYAESKEVIGGFFVMEASDYDEAVAYAQDCPHLRFGGTIHLRQVDAYAQGD